MANEQCRRWHSTTVVTACRCSMPLQSGSSSLTSQACLGQGLDLLDQMMVLGCRYESAQHKTVQAPSQLPFGHVCLKTRWFDQHSSLLGSATTSADVLGQLRVLTSGQRAGPNLQGVRCEVNSAIVHVWITLLRS